MEAGRLKDEIQLEGTIVYYKLETRTGKSQVAVYIHVCPDFERI